MIEMRDLTRTFATTRALAGVNLSIGRGEAIAIAGSPGSGRTTLLRVIATLIAPTSGQVSIGGLDAVADRLRARSLVALAEDRVVEDGGMRVDEYLGFIALARRPGGASAAVGNAVRRAKLDAAARVSALEASARIRLHVAAALMIAPAVVLLDEPFRYDSRADAESSESMMKWMCERRDEGTTFVVTTDDPFRCVPLCTRTVWLANGTPRAEALA